MSDSCERTDGAPLVGRPGVALLNLGCRVNRVEIDLIASELEEAGCRICDLEDASVVVVNTCAVTGEAETKTRKALRRAVRLPQHPAVIATGCVASLFGEQLSTSVPGVVIEPDKRNVSLRCVSLLQMHEDGVAVARTNMIMGLEETAVTPTGRTRPGIKIQDGCDNRCSFCIVWKARGPSRSLSVDEVTRSVVRACERGAHEVVLTGINLGNFRSDHDSPLGDGKRLEDLLVYLMDKTPVERIRLSSIEPPDVTNNLLKTMAESGGRIAPFLHVCLQSGCDTTLRRMRRVYDTAYFADMVERSRSAVPDIALGTDLIVGFPEESDADFEQSYAFCERIGFARMHVFRYSKRPGTPAAGMEQVDATTKAERAHRMMTLAGRMRAEQMAREVGKSDHVIVQAPGKAVTSRLFDAMVDTALMVGSYVPVRFSSCDGKVLNTL